MDKLDEMFLQQQFFQAALDKRLGQALKKGIDSVSLHEKQEITKQTVIQLFSEVNEVLNEINWKDHKEHVPVDEQKLKEEILDVFIFVINLALTWGVTSEEFYKTFSNKIIKNTERFIK